MDPRISIIIPIYNTEYDLLKRCVNSILNQTYTNFEVLMIDDGSSSECAKKIDLLGKRDRRIKVIHKDNEGVSQTRNTGIELAKGEFIAFVDSDDTVSQNFLQEAISAMTLHVDIVFGKSEWIKKRKVIKTNCSGCKYVTKNYISLSDRYQKEKVLKRLLYWPNTDEAFKDGFQPEIWCKLYRKNLFENIRFKENIKIGEDILFMSECIMNSSGICIVNSMWYQYYINDNSVMNTHSLDKLDQYILFYTGLKEFCIRNNFEEILRVRTFFLISELLSSVLQKLSLREILNMSKKIYRYDDIADNLSKIGIKKDTVPITASVCFMIGINYFSFKIAGRYCKYHLRHFVKVILKLR